VRIAWELAQIFEVSGHTTTGFAAARQSLPPGNINDGGR